MGKETKIEWCHHTFNPWRGCSRVSEGCRFCYAETLSNRNPQVLGKWGPNGTRVVASESGWKEPIRWNKQAQAAGERRRVFCASLADVFEGWQGPMENASGLQLWKRGNGTWTTSDHYPDTVALTMDHVRERLLFLIRDTPHLDWLILTKRPENILPVYARLEVCDPDAVLPNLWLGVSTENQAEADRRILVLLQVPAAVHFLSAEPLLGPIDLEAVGSDEVLYGRLNCLTGQAMNTKVDSLGYRDTIYPNGTGAISWVIVGGESGHGARPCQVEWVRSIVAQCRTAGVPVFVKQLGAHPEVDNGEEPPARKDGRTRFALNTWLLQDPKGGDPEGWPEDLRVREFPHVPRKADGSGEVPAQGRQDQRPA